MRKAKPSVCRQMGACLYAHLSAWLHSPRTLVMGVILLLYTYMHAVNFRYMLSLYDHTAHVGEMIFWYLNSGFNIVMTSTFLLIMVSEIPKRIAFQNSILARVPRSRWVISLVLFCIVVVLLMMVLMTAFCALLSLPYTTPGNGWSDLERWAENPDYQYERQLVPEYIRVLSPFQACLCAASVIFCFWLTMLLVILTCSVLGFPHAGLLLYMFILQFALTFLFEAVPGMRTPIHYATLNNMALQFPEKELATLPALLAVYLAIDAVLIAAMMFRVHHTDLQFSGKE